jgi:hypothetical protein
MLFIRVRNLYCPVGLFYLLDLYGKEWNSCGKWGGGERETTSSLNHFFI